MGPWSRRQFCVSASTAALATHGILSAGPARASSARTSRQLAGTISADRRLATVRDMGRTLLASGLRAGSGYPEVWIRDTNTFMEAALEVTSHTAMRDALCDFFLLQGEGGDIVDGYVPRDVHRTAAYRFSPQLPASAGFKNTVESDQESSLVSAIRKYITVTNDRDFLGEQINGTAVLQRLRMALEYLLKDRWDSTRGLVWAGATIDWGDIEPEDKLGDQIDERSHPACSIYPNAMFAVAIGDYLSLLPANDPERKRWMRIRDTLAHSVRTHLWDARKGKYRTHLYLKGSPFPSSFDEDAILYYGGTAIAVEAGFLTRDEVRSSLALMRKGVQDAHASSIGLTVYPPYPVGYFLNPSVAKQYNYQNGGDWCWFGARMVQQLITHDLVADAYREFSPMLDRVILHNDFYEWWSPDNQPRGSAHFRGSAGVMLKAITMFQAWASANA